MRYFKKYFKNGNKENVKSQNSKSKKNIKSVSEPTINNKTQNAYSGALGFLNRNNGKVFLNKKRIEEIKSGTQIVRIINDNLNYILIWGDETTNELINKFSKSKRSEKAQVYKLITSVFKIYDKKKYNSFILKFKRK